MVFLSSLHTGRDRLAIQVLGTLAEGPERNGDVRDLGARLDDRLARLGAQGLGERLVVLMRIVKEPYNRFLPTHTLPYVR